MSRNTNWIYNDYEFENRVNNLAWTISGMYDEDLDSSEKDYSSKDVSLYFAIIAGARRKYLDWNIIKRYIMSRIKKSYNKDILYTLIELILNSVVEDKVINERPGVEEIRNKAYKDVLKNYSKIHQEDILQTLRYTFILQSMDKHPAVDGLTRRIIKDIKELQKFVTIEGIFSHFSTSFYKESWTSLQYNRFTEIIKILEENKINIPIRHISNSSAFIRFPQMNLNAVRIGSAFLGRVAVANKLGLKKIGYLESEISEIKALPKGWNIGYSNTYKTRKETKVAIVPTGYAEGYHMKLSSDMLSFGNKVRDVIQAIKRLFKDTKLYVEINNKRYPILGRIGMYHVTVNITGEDFKIGEKVKMNANPLYVDSSVRRLYK